MNGVRAAGAGLLIFVVAVFSGCAPYGWPRADERVVRNVTFASRKSRNLRMDLYLPKTKEPAPVVIWIFGGSWKFGSKRFHVNLRELTRYGIAVAAIDYRLSGEAIYPAQLEDGEAAVAWLQAHGGEYHLDVGKIGLSGESAGGHLAALLGTVEGRERIRAVCAFYPPTDLVSLGRQYANQKKPSDIERLLGGRIEERLTLAAGASPVNHVDRSSPPILLIHGKRDTLVPISQSYALDQKLRDAGVESRVWEFPERGHWFSLNKSEVAEVASFFRKHFR